MTASLLDLALEGIRFLWLSSELCISRLQQEKTVAITCSIISVDLWELELHWGMIYEVCSSEALLVVIWGGSEGLRLNFQTHSLGTGPIFFSVGLLKHHYPGRSQTGRNFKYVLKLQVSTTGLRDPYDGWFR